MKKIRKGTQLKLTNPKNAGRAAINDRGIRHTKREVIFRPTPTHLTIKLNKADIQNKFILKGLRHAIMRARLQGLRIVHYSLEYNHVHIYAEVTDNLSLAKGMKALGVLHDFKILGVKLNPADKKLFTETRALREVLDELELFKKELKYV